MISEPEPQGEGGTAKPKRARKQSDLPGVKGPGVEKPVIKEIDEAAADYVDKRDKRISATEKEVTAKKALIDLMHSHKLKVYEFDDKVVRLKPKDETETLEVKARADYKESDGVTVD